MTRPIPSAREAENALPRETRRIRLREGLVPLVPLAANQLHDLCIQLDIELITAIDQLGCRHADGSPLTPSAIYNWLIGHCRPVRVVQDHLEKEWGIPRVNWWRPGVYRALGHRKGRALRPLADGHVNPPVRTPAEPPVSADVRPPVRSRVQVRHDRETARLEAAKLAEAKRWAVPRHMPAAAPSVYDAAAVPRVRTTWTNVRPIRPVKPPTCPTCRQVLPAKVG
jgi:hypothetical protein